LRQADRAHLRAHCPDDSPLFVAKYTHCIGVVIDGMFAGRRLLRWRSGRTEFWAL
jgi:hypothetical protein